MELTEKPEFRFLAGYFPGSVAVFNLQKSYYEFISDDMRAILGYTPRTFVDEKGMNFVFEATVQEHTELFTGIMDEIFSYIFKQAAVVNAQDFRFSICMKLKTSNGSAQWYLMDTNILQVDASGLPARIIFTMVNIDRLKKDSIMYYEILKRDEEGVFKPVLQKSISESGPVKLLTERECEILGLISKGHTSSQIAGNLFISLFTVQTHRKNIKRKLRCKSNGELINYALARGIA